MLNVKKNENIFNKFVIEIPENINKKDFIQYLFNHGIEAQKTYMPLHLQKKFVLYGESCREGKVFILDTKERLPRTENVCENLVAIPIDSNMSEEEIKYVALCIRRFFRR